MQEFVHKVWSEFLKSDAPDPHNWTLSSCFHAFLSVWVHSGPLRYHTKLEAKQAKLVQLMHKFVPGCLVRVILNERPRSTQLDPKLMFWCVYFRLGAYGTVLLFTKLGAKWANLVQLMQMFVPQSLVRISQNERSRSTKLDPKLMFYMFLSIWVHSGPLRYHTKLYAKQAKQVQLMQKFVPEGLVRGILNECSWSTELDPKLMFWGLFFSFGCIWNRFATVRNLLQNAPDWCN